MAAAFQNIGAIDSVTGTGDSDLSIALPSGTISSGDLLVIAVVTGNSGLPSSSGWTVTGTAGDDTVFLWKIAGASETGPVTVTVGTSSSAAGAMMHFTGNNSTGITDHTYTSSGGSTQLDLPSVTVSSDGSGIIWLATCLYATFAGTVTSCSRGSAVERADDVLATDVRSLHIYTEDNVSSGTVSGAYFTMSETSSQYRSNALLIPPSGGGGSTIPVINHHRRLMGMI